MRWFPFLLTAPALLAGLLSAGPERLPAPRRTFQPAAGDGSVACFSATGNLVAVSGSTPAVAVFQTRTGLLLRTFDKHRAPVTDLAFAPHPDTVLSVDAKGQAQLWRAETLALLGAWQAPVPLLAAVFAPRGGRAVLVSGKACWLWNLRAAGQQPTPLKLALPAGATITAATFGTDGRQLALGLSSGVALLVNLQTGAQVQKTLGDKPVRSLYLRADTLLAATNTPDLKLWPTRPDAAVQRLPLPQALTAIAPGPDVSRLALGFASGEAMIWHRAASRAEFQIQGKGPASCVQVQPDGSALLLAAFEKDTPKTWLLPAQ